MLFNFLSFWSACSVLVSSTDLKIYGYVYHTKGGEIFKLFFGSSDKDVYFPLLTPHLPDYKNYTIYRENSYHDYTIYHNYDKGYFMSYTFKLENIDNKNGTQLIQIYHDYHEFNPYIISQYVNNAFQRTSKFNGEYFVITDIAILCKIDVDENNFNYHQTDPICNASNGDVSNYNDQIHHKNDESWFIMDNSDIDVSIINFFVKGTSFFTHAEMMNDTFICLVDSGQYDLFYPHKSIARGTEDYIKGSVFHSSNNSNNHIYFCEYHQYNTHIVYLGNVTLFETDIHKIDSFNIDLMQKQYMESTRNGSFIYYGIGGICSGSFCIDNIQWVQPLLPHTVSMSPTSNPTGYPTHSDTWWQIDEYNVDNDRPWFIVAVVFIILFVFSTMTYCGIIIYLWSKKDTIGYDRTPQDNTENEAVPITN